jgi:radical SAM superfamily enzyme YgiQ (UPF0313 family)
MRIALIAMSGIRVQNAELLELGLTLPGFVERSKVIASLPSLGLLTLAGMTPKGFELDYIEVADLSEIEELPQGYDAVAISSFTAQIKEAYALSARFREAGVKTILGGLHVTMMPQEALGKADAILTGEGELLWPQILDDLRRGALRAHYDARGRSFDLAQAPMPRFDLLDPERYNRITVQTQRGCPFSCEFCASSIHLSQRYKQKPVAKVLSELRRIRQLWDKPFIEFADDNTFVNKRYGKELMRAMIPERLRWFTETDISVAEDPELLALMQEAGCAQILIGLESPSPDGLKGLERKTDWKAKQLDRYGPAIERIQRAGISVNGCFILGLDGTGPESFDAVFDFVRESELAEVQVTLATPFPGTPFYQRLEREGRLTHPGAWERCTLFDLNFCPQGMSREELEQGFARLVTRLYSESETQRRHRGFRDKLRALHRKPALRGAQRAEAPAQLRV